MTHESEQSTLSSPDTSTPAVENQDQVSALRRERLDFEEAVRAEILHLKEENKWCVPGTNHVLDDLGLPLIKRHFTGTITVSVTVLVKADSVDQAASWVPSALELTSNDEDVTIEDFTVHCPDGVLAARDPD